MGTCPCILEFPLPSIAILRFGLETALFVLIFFHSSSLSSSGQEELWRHFPLSAWEPFTEAHTQRLKRKNVGGIEQGGKEIRRCSKRRGATPTTRAPVSSTQSRLVGGLPLFHSSSSAKKHRRKEENVCCYSSDIPVSFPSFNFFFLSSLLL